MAISSHRRSTNTSMTALLKDISESIKLMHKMVKSIGTTSDTIEERRKFTALKTSVHQQIVKATNKMNTGLRNKDYENEFLLQEYVDSFRKVVQIAVKHFRLYKPYNKHIHHKIQNKLPNKKQNYSTFEESQPLLTNNPFHDAYDHENDNNNNNYYQSQHKQMNIIYDINDDETKTLEENEEKMVYISEELSEMKDLFANLDEIVTDEQEIVNLIEASVEQSKYDTTYGADQLIKAEKKLKKLRCNKCVILIGLIAILSSFLIYLWITTKLIKK